MHCIHGQTINLLNSCLSLDSYIKPQQDSQWRERHRRCLSLDSYIKPQPFEDRIVHHYVVYLLIPTSNHNTPLEVGRPRLVVYLLIPTSNHNWSTLRKNAKKVVYLLIPTSNHNNGSASGIFLMLFIS